MRPDIGCGCFGEFSSTPVTGRTIARSILLAVAALGTVNVQPIQLRGASADPSRPIAALAAPSSSAIFALLSPEVRDLLVRIGYSAPCELRVPSPEQTLPRCTAAASGAGIWRCSPPTSRSTSGASSAGATWPSRAGTTARTPSWCSRSTCRTAGRWCSSALVDTATGAVIAVAGRARGRPAGIGVARTVLRRGTHAAPQPELPAWLARVAESGPGSLRKARRPPCARNSPAGRVAPRSELSIILDLSCTGARQRNRAWQS